MTTAPGVVEVAYDGFSATTVSLNGVVKPCNDCVFVNGGLVTVKAQVPSTLSSSPVAGATVDIVQGGNGQNDYTDDEPCYPYSTSGEEVCGSPPTGDPSVASDHLVHHRQHRQLPVDRRGRGRRPRAITLTAAEGLLRHGVNGCTSVSRSADTPVATWSWRTTTLP